jgi:type II secretory pathway component PulK
MSTSPNRRGAALVVALVLIAFIGIVASTTLPQILRDRQEARMELVRQQAQRLSDDALHKAEAKRQTDSGFSGETITLGPDQQPFLGTFQVTTNYRNDRFETKIEYRNEKGKTLYSTGK